MLLYCFLFRSVVVPRTLAVFGLATVALHFTGITLPLLIGLPIALCGLALRAWAAGCLAKNRQLARGGPYAHLRNPLYLGTLLVAAGLVAASRNVWLGVLFAAVFAFVYLPVIELEEQHLRELFPEFSDYAAQVPALVPRLTPAPAKNPQPFRWSLYLRNKEYQAGAGFAAGMLYLLWKL